MKKGHGNMLIDLTAAEKRKTQEIVNGYQPERERIAAAIEAAHASGDQEELTRLLMQQQAVIESLEAALNANFDKMQRKRFKPIKEAGTAAIIAHAKEQAPALLEYIHTTTKNQYRGANAEAYKSMGIGTIKDGLLYLNANYATQALRDELKLHIEALLEDKAALQELLAVIIEAVENSDYTDNTEITDQQQKPLEVMRFRRNPLADITTYGLMNDKASAQLIQDGEIFQAKADGQLTLRWAVNQAPQNREVVPVYMALTYEGSDYKVTKKLSDYDKRVYEAVGTRFYYWQQDNPQKPLYITPQEIWRTMNGKSSRDGKAKPSDKQIKRICDSLDKMRFTRFYMDISAEIEAFNLSIDDERITGGRIETYVLNSSKVEFTTDKGNTVQGYRIGEEPILYTYNKAKQHILYVPYEMLDTSSYTSDSENVTEFKGYLLQQIQLMKNAQEGGKRFKRSNVILLETIYRDTGILPPEERIEGDYANEATRQQIIRRNRKADRQKIEGLLDAWKAKGWINGYTVLNAKNEPIKEKQQAKGYSISI